MKIVILNRRYCPGEAWTNRILAYAKGFAELGEEVVLYYLIADKARTPYDINIPGVKIVNLWEKDGFIARKVRHISFIKNLMTFRKEIQLGDKFFVYGGYEYQLYVALKVKHKAKVFCEITEHPNIHGNSAKIERANARKIKMLKQLDGLFVISNSLKEYFVKQGISKEKIHIVNMFVDTNRFTGLEKTTKDKYIAYCGAVSYDKDGCDTLIKAFSIFAKRHCEYKLYIIGKGINDEVIPSLKNLAKESGVEKSVVFTGQISPEQMPQILFNSSVLALARPDNLQSQNGFPTKLGEYLATGNPIVVTRVGEIPNFIEDNETGFLANPNDPQDFASRLSWVVEHKEDALLVAARGKQLALNEFNYKSQSHEALCVIDDYYKSLYNSGLWGGGKKV